MRKSIRLLLLCIITLFSLSGIVACSDQVLTQSTHDCLYSELSASNLGKATTNSPHDFSAEQATWEEDRPASAPLVKAYNMTYSFTPSTNITLGENVYIGICTHAADLNLNQIKITLSENSGFYVYDCSYHGCYAQTENVEPISLDFLTFAYHYTCAQAGIVDTETNSLVSVPFVLPAGNYATTSYVNLVELVNNKMLSFANASATTICLNNQVYADSAEATALRALGVTVYTTCREEIVNNATHECTYIPDKSLSQPVSQEAFYEIAPSVSFFPVNSANPLNNFMFFHLTESISYEETVQVPAGLTIAVCKNGFDFDVEYTGNVYVFDCTPHVCICNDLCETTPLWKDGVTMLASYLKVLHQVLPEQFPTETIPLPADNYALMEDFEAGTFPFEFTCSEDVTFCLNGHTIAGMEEALSNDYTWDCTKVPAEEVVTHVCNKLTPHITALDGTMLLDYINEDGELTFSDCEVAFILPCDVVLEAPVIIPTGVKLNLCLNGYSIYASERLMKASNSYLFLVEYGASLTIVDCSPEQSGGVMALTPEAATNATFSFNGNNTPIVNLGTCVLDGGEYTGALGLQNHGTLIMKDGTINGLFVGVMTQVASADTYPLHSSRVATYIYGGNVNGLLAGIISQGPLTLEDCTITATQAGVVNSVSLLDGSNLLTSSPMSVKDVDIVLSLDPVPGYFPPEVGTSIKQALSGVCGVISNGTIDFYGDLSVEADNSLLEPVETENGYSFVMLVDMYMINASCDIKPGVELTDTYVVYFEYGNAEAPVIANQDVSECFVLMEGYAGVMNDDGNYVVVPNSEAEFMDNAQLTYSMLNMEGYIRMEFHFSFDTNQNAPLFLNDPDCKIKISIEDDVLYIDPNDREQVEDLGQGNYRFSLNVYPKDYRNKIRIQFTNGTYVWTGTSNISVETFLVNFLYDAESEIAKADAILNAEAGAYTPEQIAAAYETKVGMVAYKNVILSMLNYCDAAAVHFGEKDSYTVRDNNFNEAQPAVMMLDDSDEMPSNETSIMDAMNNITVDTFRPYKSKLHEGSTLPAGVKLTGITLLLDSGTDIRYYFQIDPSVDLNKITFTIDDKEVELIAHKNPNTYYLLVENLSPLQMKQLFHVVVTDGTNTYSFEYGVFSYMYNVMNNPNSSNEMIYLARAMWLYAQQMESSLYALMGNSDSGEGYTNE